MSKKKSYMDIRNIISEGIIEKILSYIKKRKLRKLDKIFRDQPEIKAKIHKFNRLATSTEKYLKSKGVDHKIRRL